MEDILDIERPKIKVTEEELKPLSIPMDGKEVGYREILIDLDCLLDTRLGTIGMWDDKKAFECGFHPEYRIRTEDSFLDAFCPNSTFLSLWRERCDKRLPDGFYAVIAASGETPLPFAVYEYLNEEILGQSERPSNLEDFKITINVFPYHLPKEEMRALKMIGDHLFPQIKEVEVTYLDVKELTPAKIRRRYDSYWLYDLPNYLNTHVDEFKTTVHPNTRLFAPRIMYLHRFDKELDEISLKLIEDKEKLFQEIETVSKLWMDLRYIDVSYYCVPPPHLKEDEEKEKDNIPPIQEENVSTTTFTEYRECEGFDDYGDE